MNLTQRVTDLESWLYNLNPEDRNTRSQQQIKELQTVVSHLRADMVHLIEFIGVSGDEFYCEDENLPWEDDSDPLDEDESDDEEEYTTDDVKYVIVSGNRPENKGITAYRTKNGWTSKIKEAFGFSSRAIAKAHIREKRIKAKSPGHFPPTVLEY